MTKAKTTTTTTRALRRAATQTEGPLYRAIELSQIDNKLIPPDGEVVYYGLPGSNLAPVNAEARARKQAVRSIRTDPKLDDAAKAEKLRVLSNEYNGVEDRDAFEESELGLDEPLPDAERAKLEQAARQTAEDTANANEGDLNRVGVKLQGQMEETQASKQGATPVLDGKKK